MRTLAPIDHPRQLPLAELRLRKAAAVRSRPSLPMLRRPATNAGRVVQLYKEPDQHSQFHLIEASMLRLAVFALFATITSRAQALDASCGLSSMIETTTPTYLPLGRAARVQGTVILMANVGTDGLITSLNVVSGPAMLRSGALDFAKGWKANAYSGPRTCPLVSRMCSEPKIGPSGDGSICNITLSPVRLLLAYVTRGVNLGPGANAS